MRQRMIFGDGCHCCGSRFWLQAELYRCADCGNPVRRIFIEAPEEKERRTFGRWIRHQTKRYFEQPLPSTKRPVLEPVTPAMAAYLDQVWDAKFEGKQ